MDLSPSVLKTKFPQGGCTHCGSPLPRPAATGMPAFCCAGCETVHALLTSHDMTEYYRLRALSAEAPLKPVRSSGSSYAYLDDPEFLRTYCTSVRAKNVPDVLSMDFFLEDVHCAACLWLVEKLPELVAGVQSSNLDLSRAVATVTLAPGGTFSAAALRLEQLGYRPHPVRADDEAQALAKKEERSRLIRIGVAGASTGNIMLMAVPLYAGATGTTALWFRWLSLVLFLPVLFYAATPFYRSAWQAVRGRALSIDVPITLAILLGALVSVIHLSSGSEHIYFDSLAALVFLLLASRHVLLRLQKTALSGSHLLQFLAPARARVLRKGDAGVQSTTEVPAESLKAGDLVAVSPGEPFPADGVIQNGSGSINSAVLTGESAPMRVTRADRVYCGTINIDGDFLVTVESAGRETALGSILTEIERASSRKAPIVAAADRISRWFLAVVLLAATATVFFSPSIAEGIQRALALIIVTCPCALALATPLAMSMSLSRAARHGMLIKSAKAIERLTQIKSVVLDKTGTVTEACFEVLEYHEVRPDASIKRAIAALENRAKHPVARALVRFAQSDHLLALAPVENFSEQPGVGVSGIVEGKAYEIRALDRLPNGGIQGTHIGVYRDGALCAWAVLGDRLRADAKAGVDQLRRLGLGIRLATGDNAQVAQSVAGTIGISPEHVFATVTPAQKRKIVEDSAPALMVGDGANDALALARAHVGVAVHGSMDVSLRAADVYLVRPGVGPVANLVSVALETMKVLRRNFGFSLAYNALGGVASILGLVTPLFAAVLMPLSALTVFASSALGTRALRRILP